jgi:hypothetical protein
MRKDMQPDYYHVEIHFVRRLVYQQKPLIDSGDHVAVTAQAR